MKNQIEIEMVSGVQIGRCCYRHVYHIRSRNMVSDQTVNGLRSLGLLGCGQHFSFRRIAGTSETPFLVEATNTIDSGD